jgi:hypothetical protein
MIVNRAEKRRTERQHRKEQARSGYTDSRRKRPATVRLLGTTLPLYGALAIAIFSVMALTIGMMELLPRLLVEPYISTDSPASQFKVTNDSFFSVYNLRFRCRPNRLETPPPFRIIFTPHWSEQYLLKQTLLPTEATRASCPVLNPAPGYILTAADVDVEVSFALRWWHWPRINHTRYLGILDSKGVMHWSPRPI